MIECASLDEARAVPTVIHIECGQTFKAWQVGDTIPGHLKPALSDVPGEVTMRQARLALHQSGKLATVATVIAGMSEPQKSATQIWWEYSGTVQRSQPLVAQLGAAIGLTPSGVDDLFKVAITL